jgi:hypothetical protein
MKAKVIPFELSSNRAPKSAFKCYLIKKSENLIFILSDRWSCLFNNQKKEKEFNSLHFMSKGKDKSFNGYIKQHAYIRPNTLDVQHTYSLKVLKRWSTCMYWIVFSKVRPLICKQQLHVFVDIPRDIPSANKFYTFKGEWFGN